MKKRILALLLSALMLSNITACQTTTPPENPDSSTDASTNLPTDTPTGGQPTEDNPTDEEEPTKEHKIISCNGTENQSGATYTIHKNGDIALSVADWGEDHIVSSLPANGVDVQNFRYSEKAIAINNKRAFLMVNQYYEKKITVLSFEKGSQEETVVTLDVDEAAEDLFGNFINEKTGYLFVFCEVNEGPAGSAKLSSLFLTYDGGKTWNSISIQNVPSIGLRNHIEFAKMISGSVGLISGGIGPADYDFCNRTLLTTDGGLNWVNVDIPELPQNDDLPWAKVADFTRVDESYILTIRYEGGYAKYKLSDQNTWLRIDPADAPTNPPAELLQYQRILDIYWDLLILKRDHENYDEIYLENNPLQDDEISNAVFHAVLRNTPSKMGYSLHDINADGVNELILLDENYHIYTIFTVVNDQVKVVDLFFGDVNDTGAIAPDGTIYKRGYGKGESYYRYAMKLSQDGTLVGTLFGCGDDDPDDSFVQYYKIVNQKVTEIDKAEFESLNQAFCQTVGNSTDLTKSSGLSFIQIDLNTPPVLSPSSVSTGTPMLLKESGDHWRIWEPRVNAEWGLVYDLLDEKGELVYRIPLEQYHRDVHITERSNDILYIVNGSFMDGVFHRIYNVKTGQLSDVYQNMIAQHNNTVAYLEQADEEGLSYSLCIKNAFDRSSAPITYQANLPQRPIAAWFSEDLSELYIIANETEFHTISINNGAVTDHKIGKMKVSLDTYDEVLDLCKTFSMLAMRYEEFGKTSGCDWMEFSDDATRETAENLYATFLNTAFLTGKLNVNYFYSLKDINGDGCDELIICQGSFLYTALFTMHEGRPVLLHSTRFRNESWVISEDGLLGSYVKIGNGVFDDGYYCLASGGKTLTHVETFREAFGEGSKSVYYHKVGTGEFVELSEEEYVRAIAESPYFGKKFEPIVNEETLLPLDSTNTPSPLPFFYEVYTKG